MDEQTWKNLQELSETDGIRVVSGSRPDTIVVFPNGPVHVTVNKLCEVLKVNSLEFQNYWGSVPDYPHLGISHALPIINYAERLRYEEQVKKIEEHLASQESGVLRVWATKPGPNMAKWRNMTTEAQTRYFLNVIDEYSEIGAVEARRILARQTRLLGEPGQIPLLEVPPDEV